MNKNYFLACALLFTTLLGAQKKLITSIQYGRASTGLNGGRFGAGVGMKFNKKFLMVNYSISDLSYDDSYYLKENYLYLDKNFEKFPFQGMKRYNQATSGYASFYPRVFTTQIKTLDITGGLDVFENKRFVFSIGAGLSHQLVDERVQAVEFTSKVTYGGELIDTNILIPFFDKFYDFGYLGFISGGYKLNENCTISLNVRLDRMICSDYSIGSGFLSFNNVIR